MPRALNFTDVVVRREGRNIVDHVNWAVTDDQRWVVLGPNGAGKTTLLQLAAIAESTTDAIMGSTLDGTVTSWNQGAEKLLGYRASEIKGHLMSLIVPAERQGEFDLLLESIGRGEVIQNLETVRQRKDGTRLEVSLSASPIRDTYGRIIGASVIARDITERRRSEMMMAARLRLLECPALRDHRQVLIHRNSDFLEHVG